MMYITSFFAAAIVISYFFSAAISLIFSGVTALFLFSSTVIKAEKKVVLLLTFSMVSGVICYVIDIKEGEFSQEQIGSKVKINCVISQPEMKTTIGIDGEEKEYLQIKAKKEGLLIKYYGTDTDEKTVEDNLPNKYIPGESIEVIGVLEKPQERRNPGCFDYSMYLKSIGIEYVLIAESLESCRKQVVESPIKSVFKRIRGELFVIKEDFITNIERYAGVETAGLMRAIMFGEKTDIDEEILEEFQNNGTAHVLAVSGLHVGIIYGFLNVLWVWRKGRVFFLLNVIFFLAYMTMSSFSPSVVRAVIMVWIHIFAKLNNRRYDMASAAFLTALLMLIDNPMHIFNVGFQMSFIAVLTLSLLIPVIKQFYSGILLSGIAIQAGLTPFILYVFNYFSFVTLFVNIPIIFLTGIIVPTGMCCMIAMAVIEPLGAFVAKTLGGLCIIMYKLNDLTAIEGITVFDVRSPPLWVVVLYYLVLMVFVSEDGRLLFLRNQNNKIKQLGIIVITISLIFGMAAGNHFKSFDMVFVDVGQGDCIHFRAGRNGDYLVDGGGSISYEVGKKTLKPYLLKNGTKRIDGAFVTHLHTDHYKGVAELCREGMVDRVFVFEGYMVREEEILRDTGLEKKQITYLRAGQTIRLNKNVCVEVIWPEGGSYNKYVKMSKGEEDENQFSLILKISINGRSAIMTGDVDAACLDNLAELYGETLDTDILKVAHHGSKYSKSEAFINAVNPRYAVFQVGKNNFGHPDKGVIENFRQKGIMIYRNDTDGAVAFDFAGNGRITVRAIRGE